MSSNNSSAVRGSWELAARIDSARFVTRIWAFVFYGLALGLRVLSSVMAYQQAHSRDIGNRLYSSKQDIHADLSSSQVLQVFKFSALVHRLWGLSSRAGPTEVTSEMLKALARRGQVTAKFDDHTAELHELRRKHKEDFRALQDIIEGYFKGGRKGQDCKFTAVVY
jgi:hypothetical protein